MTAKQRFLVFSIVVILVGTVIVVSYFTQLSSANSVVMRNGIATRNAAIDTMVAETFSAPSSGP